jgi:anti-sigma regulatory factor (Ser/Thr protein kinase)
MPTITVSGELSSLAPIADFVVDQARAVGLDKHAAYQLRLAVDEIATNIILHGYEENDLVGDVVVTAERDSDRLTVTLEDAAPPYDPCRRDVARVRADFDKPLEDRAIGGLGVYFAMQAVDEFRYEYRERRNRNIFVVNTSVPAMVDSSR